MDRTEVIRRLTSLPAQIEAQRAVAEKAAVTLKELKSALEEREDYFVLSETVDGSSTYLTGRNSEQRAAQLRELTRQERKRVRDAEEQRATAERLLFRLLDDFSAMKYTARVLAAAHEG